MDIWNLVQGSDQNDPIQKTYGLEAIVPMEFLVTSLRLVVQEKLPMEESREHRILELLKLEQVR